MLGYILWKEKGSKDLQIICSQVDKKAEAIVDAARRKEALGVEKAGLVRIVIVILKG